MLTGMVYLVRQQPSNLSRVIVRTSESTKNVAMPADLEVKDAQLIFNSVWKELEAEYGRAQLYFPKELILLGGAPGSGKGIAVGLASHFKLCPTWRWKRHGIANTIG